VSSPSGPAESGGGGPVRNVFWRAWFAVCYRTVVLSESVAN